MKTSILLTLSFLVTGCGYAQTQVDLIDQTRRGIEYAKTTQTSYAQVIDQLHDLQRKNLDDAFDADVREQKAIDADWVIEQRRAYAAALEAMAQQRFAARQSAATAQQNLDAIDQAMQKLRWLQTIPLSWFNKSDK